MANQHVVPNNGKWQLKRENAARATKTIVMALILVHPKIITFKFQRKIWLKNPYYIVKCYSFFLVAFNLSCIVSTSTS